MTAPAPRPLRPSGPSGRDTGPLFLEPQSYRRRRLVDAARLLPVAVALLLCIPLLGPAESGASQGGAARLLYLFGVWAAAICASAALSRALRRWDAAPRPSDIP